jgi:hypothetical protein
MGRCYDCASLVGASCPDHPSADVVRWGQRESYCWFYLDSAPIAEVFAQFDRTLTDPQHSRYYPGVTRDDLSRVLHMWERWEGTLPEMGARKRHNVSPRGLFG